MMYKKKAIAFGITDPQWVEVFVEIARISNVRLGYATAMRKSNQHIHLSFPNCRFHTLADAIKGLPPEGSKWEQRAPDPQTLTALESHQSIILQLMDRLETSTRQVTLKERMRLYYRLVSYWEYTFKEVEPIFAFFPISPHAAYDYIAYQLCRHMNIPTVVCNRTGLPSRVLVQNLYNQPPLSLQPLGNVNQTLSDDNSLASDLKEHLYKIQFSKGFDTLPVNMQSRLKLMGQSSMADIVKPEPYAKIIRYELANLANRIRGQKISHVPDVYFASPNKAIEESRYTMLSEMRVRFSAFYRKKSLREFYQKHQQFFDVNNDQQSYIYVPLHYQPERSTLPLGGRFADQIFMIRLISDSCPTGWKVFVKEHPMQWNYYKKGEQGRVIQDYKDLVDMDNVTLLPPEQDSRSLIAAAKATATISGSAGWESINLNIPCLLFGSAWFEGAPGVTRIKEKRELEACLTRLNSCENEAWSYENIAEFVKQIDNRAIYAVIDTVREECDADIISRASNLAEAVLRCANIPCSVENENSKSGRKESYGKLEELLKKDVAKPRLVIYAERAASAQEFAELAMRLKKKGCFEVLLIVSGRAVLRFVNRNIGNEVPTFVLGDVLFYFEKNKKKRKAVKKRSVIISLTRWAIISIRTKLQRVLKPVKTKLRRVLKPKNFRFLGHLRDLIFVIINVSRSKYQAETLNKYLKPDIILIGDDRTLGFAQGLGYIARKHGVPVVTAQYAVTSELGGAKMRSNKSIYYIDKGILAPVKRWLCKRHPEQVLEYKGSRLMFHNLFVLIALRLTGCAFNTPWAIGGGFSTKTLLIDKAELDSSLRVGANDSRYAVVGQASLDKMYELHREKKNIREKAIKDYGLQIDKLMIIFAVPHYAEHKMLEWEQHLSNLDQVFSVLASSPYNVLLSLHPRADVKRYICLAEKYSLPIASEALRDLMVCSDVFLATYSSTIKWAYQLNIKTIVVDTHKFELDYFPELNLDVAYTIEELAKKLFVFTKEVDARKRKEINIDGQCVQRINSELASFVHVDELLDKNEKEDTQAIKRAS